MAGTATRERQLTVLAALAHYDTWHSAGFLRGKTLIPADMSDAEYWRCGTALAGFGDAERRDSVTKGPMFKITGAGKARLLHDTTRRTA
jgi:hypothetical protein